MFYAGRYLVIFGDVFREDRFRFEVLPNDMFVLRSNSRVVINQYAPRVEDRYTTIFRRLRTISIMTAGMAVILVRIRERIFAFRGRMVTIIIRGAKRSGQGIKDLLVFRFRFQYFMITSTWLIMDSDHSYQRRHFNNFRFVTRVRRRFLTEASVLRIGQGLRFRDLLKHGFRIKRSTYLRCFPIYRWLPFRVVYERITRRVFIRSVSLAFNGVHEDDPCVLVRVDRFVDVQVERTIKTSWAIVIRIIIQDIMFIRVTTVAVSVCSIFIFPITKLVCGIPSGSALVFQVFASSVPMFFRSSL